MMIEKLRAKNLKSSGRMMQKVQQIAGGLGGAALPPMMIEEVMIQKGPTKKTKNSRGSSVPLRQGLMVQVRVQTRAN